VEKSRLKKNYWKTKVKKNTVEIIDRGEKNRDSGKKMKKIEMVEKQ